MERDLKEEGENRRPDSSLPKVDSGKPASLTWQRKLNASGNIPAPFTLRFQEKMHMAPLGLRLWLHVIEEAAKGKIAVFEPSVLDFFKQRSITCQNGVPLGGIGKHWKKL